MPSASDVEEGALGELLWKAIDGKDHAMAAHLLSTGVKPDTHKTEHGTTALLRAAEKGDVPGIVMLLKHGADPAHKNRFKETALSLARARNHADAARALPGGTHKTDKPNTAKVPCAKCGRVVGLGRAGLWCSRCSLCSVCATHVACSEAVAAFKPKRPAGGGMLAIPIPGAYQSCGSEDDTATPSSMVGLGNSGPATPVDILPGRRERRPSLPGLGSADMSADIAVEPAPPPGYKLLHLAALKAAELSSFSAAELHAIAPIVREVAFGAGETLLVQGERAVFVGWLARGQVRTTCLVEGRSWNERVEIDLGLGGLLGQLELFTGGPSTCTALALTAGVCARIDYAALAAFYDVDPNLAAALNEQLAYAAAGLGLARDKMRPKQATPPLLSAATTLDGSSTDGEREPNPPPKLRSAPPPAAPPLLPPEATPAAATTAAEAHRAPPAAPPAPPAPLVVSTGERNSNTSGSERSATSPYPRRSSARRGSEGDISCRLSISAMRELELFPTALTALVTPDEGGGSLSPCSRRDSRESGAGSPCSLRDSRTASPGGSFRRGGGGGVSFSPATPPHQRRSGAAMWAASAAVMSAGEGDLSRCSSSEQASPVSPLGTTDTTRIAAKWPVMLLHDEAHKLLRQQGQRGWRSAKTFEKIGGAVGGGTVSLGSLRGSPLAATGLQPTSPRRGDDDDDDAHVFRRGGGGGARATAASALSSMLGFCKGSGKASQGASKIGTSR